MIMLVKGTTNETIYINPYHISEIYINPEGDGWLIMISGKKINLNVETMKYVMRVMKANVEQRAEKQS